MARPRKITLCLILCLKIVCGQRTVNRLSDELRTLYYELEILKYNHAKTVNYALGKEAFQSSHLKYEYHVGAHAAVDGKLSGNFFDKSCTHTQGEPNPWWMVDFGANIYVGRVVIKNRSDCCWDRLKHFTVSMSESKNGPYEVFGTFNGVAKKGEIITISSYNKKFGRYLRIEMGRPGGSQEEILQLCEVQAFLE